MNEHVAGVRACTDMEEYLFDLNVLGYDDARLEPRGGMSQNEITIWTEAINKK